jgi:hypothetical protein
MAYFFPFGVVNASATSASFAAAAVTSSITASTSVIPSTASYAVKVTSSGSQGPVGPAATLGVCTDTAPQGPTGSIGPSGSRGPSLTGCPAGSVLCPGLTPPAGYAYVCIQIPDGCSGTTVCPTSF